MATVSDRVGAAALALGLTLAGPHGVAAADDVGGDPAAPSAGSAQSRQQAVATPSSRGSETGGSRGAPTAQPASSAARTAALPGGNAKRTGQRRSGKPANGGREIRPAAGAETSQTAVANAPTPRVRAPWDGEPAFGGGRNLVVANVVPVTTPAAAEAMTNLAHSRAAAFEKCAGCVAVAPKGAALIAEKAVTALVRSAKFLDDIGHWLHSVPAGPVNDLLSGALLLVRRNLFPMVPTIPKVVVADVVTDEDGDHAVLTVSLARAYTSAVTVGYATTSALTGFGAEPAELAARATEGVDHQAASGILTFAPGQTSQQVNVIVLNDEVTEVSETFGFEVFATWSRATRPAAAADQADSTASHPVTSVRLASATVTITDDDGLGIDVNPDFSYGDALLASIFAHLAYNHRNDADFSVAVQATGWEGIGVSVPNLAANGYSPRAGGYGVRDGLAMQSYAFAGKRTAADGTEQFVVAFEGSNPPWDEPADWILNAGRYGWSRYYSSLVPLMTEVAGQILTAQQDNKKTQLIITGHSLGGAAAMMAFADLLAPEGNLWPDTAEALAKGQRLGDSLGGWSPAVQTALLASTAVYTFGAPSILVEPNKLTPADAVALAARAARSSLRGALALLIKAISVLTVDEEKLPDFTGIAGIGFGTRVFQFEHANSDWWLPRTGDIVAQIGSRDPGRVLAINLDNGVQDSYTGGWAASLIPGATHPMANYLESVTRLITDSRLLKSPNKLAGDSPQLPQTIPGNGSDKRNDFFVNTSDSAGAGNDLFVYSRPGSYSASGDAGSDGYSITDYGVALLIDGGVQSGRDTVVFDVAGVPGATYYSTGSGSSNDTAVFSITGPGGQSSSVTITNWDRWQVSDVFQVIRPSDGRWRLDPWIDIDRGPAVAVTPANEIPLSVL